MTDFPRWERESQEDLRPPAQFEETAEFDMASAGLVDPGELSDPPEYAQLAAQADDFDQDLPREPRLAAARESLTATRESLATTAGKVGRWFASLDRRPEFDVHIRRDPAAELTSGSPDPASDPATDWATEPDPAAEPAAAEPSTTGRFPTTALGYSRPAVDRQLAELEAELAYLRATVDPPPPSITEEIERLGEQTASILVVAHDKAHETARRAQAQAAQAVSDAARDAERITTEAQRRLRELDEETDAVWRERARLLDDVRMVSASLATLAEDASERFPAAEPRTDAEPQPEPETEMKSEPGESETEPEMETETETAAR